MLPTSDRAVYSSSPSKYSFPTVYVPGISEWMVIVWSSRFLILTEWSLCQRYTSALYGLWTCWMLVLIDTPIFLFCLTPFSSFSNLKLATLTFITFTIIIRCKKGWFKRVSNTAVVAVSAIQGQARHCTMPSLPKPVSFFIFVHQLFRKCVWLASM